MQYLRRILTVNLSTGRDFERSVLTVRVRILHLAGEISRVFAEKINFWESWPWNFLPETFAVIVKLDIGIIKTMNK